MRNSLVLEMGQRMLGSKLINLNWSLILCSNSFLGFFLDFFYKNHAVVIIGPNLRNGFFYHVQ